MNNFDFNPAQSAAQLKIAFAYSPKVRHNRVLDRQRTGLLYIVEGEYLYRLGESCFLAEAGDLIYLPPGAKTYEYKVLSPEKQTHVYQLEIELTDIRSGIPVRFAQHPLLIKSTDEHELPKMFETIIRSDTMCTPSAKLSVYSAIYQLLSVCVGGMDENEAWVVPSGIFPAVHYINENYKTPIQTKTLADLCYISESQLRRLFAKELGISPVRYKNRLLAAEACRLLQNSELRIGEIADILGFTDVYAFSHAFTKEKGISPRSYRALHSEQ